VQEGAAPKSQPDNQYFVAWTLSGFAPWRFARFQVWFCGLGGSRCFGGEAFADFGGEDFVGDFVAGAFECAPHVPTGDGAIGTPLFAEGEEFLRLGHAFLAVGDGPTFFYAEIVDGEDVGAAEIEDEEHFDGPSADAADGDEAFDEFIVGKFFGLLARGDDAGDCFGGEIFHGEDFCVGEAGFAECGSFEFEHLGGSRRATVGAEGFDPAEDGGGGFAGDGLVGDGFHEGFVGGLGDIEVFLEFGSGEDEFGEFFVFGGEVGHGDGEIEGEDLGGRGHDWGILAQVGAGWLRSYGTKLAEMGRSSTAPVQIGDCADAGRSEPRPYNRSCEDRIGDVVGGWARFHLNPHPPKNGRVRHPTAHVRVHFGGVYCARNLARGEAEILRVRLG
jgi:hypothetical protein